MNDERRDESGETRKPDLSGPWIPFVVPPPDPNEREVTWASVGVAPSRTDEERASSAGPSPLNLGDIVRLNLRCSIDSPPFPYSAFLL